MNSKPNMISAYALPDAPEGVEKLIRPARPRREWMDRTPENYAYRCIPMTAANTMGWEILNPVNWEFRWNGLTPHTQVIVYREKELRFGHRSAQCGIPGLAKPAASNCFLQSDS